MILVIQFREWHDPSHQHEQACITARLPHPMPIRFCSVFDETVPFGDPATLLAGVDKVILGGNGAIPVFVRNKPGHDYSKADLLLERITPFANYLLEQDFPTLATCFGHQLFSYLRGAELADDPAQSQVGSFEISLTTAGKRDRLFTGMPHRFFAIEGHQISVNGLPHGATLLASSASCPSQALRFGKNIYTTQFHSELDDADLEYRMQLFPNYRKIAGDSRPNAPAPHSVTPLRNFLKWEAGQLDSLATSVTIAA